MNNEIKNIKADSIKKEKEIKIAYGKQIKEIQDKLTIAQNELDEEKNKSSSLETKSTNMREMAKQFLSEGSGQILVTSN